MAVKALKTAEFDGAIQGSHVAVVDFWADWCGPCKMVSPVIDGLEKAYGDRVLVAKVNVDDEHELAARFGVSSIPTVIFFRDGAEVERKIGVQTAGVYQAILEANL